MEDQDPSDVWEIEEIPTEESSSKVSLILNMGWVLGKKIAITGAVMSSAPIVLPPLVIFSTIGFAFAVPFGLVFAGYACTEKIMSKLLPIPSSPSLLEFGKIGSTDEESIEEEICSGDRYQEFEAEEVNGEEEEEEEDMKQTRELRIELPDEDQTREYEAERVAEEIENEDENGWGEEEEQIEERNGTVDEEKQLEESKSTVEKRRGKENGDYPAQGKGEPFGKANGTIKERENEEIVDFPEQGEKKPFREAKGEIEEKREEEKPIGEIKGVTEEGKDEGNVERISEEEVKPIEVMEGMRDEGDKPVEERKRIPGERICVENDDSIIEVEISIEETVGVVEEENTEISDISSEHASATEGKSLDNMDKETADSKELPVSAEVSEFEPKPEPAGGATQKEITIPSNENLFSEKKIWEQIDAMRTIVGYKAALHATCMEELKALYVFTGVEPPNTFKDTSDLVEVNDKLRFLMSIIGVK